MRRGDIERIDIASYRGGGKGGKAHFINGSVESLFAAQKEKIKTFVFLALFPS